MRRVGVEQEMYIIDAHGYPAPVADRVLSELNDEQFCTELARYNLEANLPPCPIGVCPNLRPLYEGTFQD